MGEFSSFNSGLEVTGQQKEPSPSIYLYLAANPLGLIFTVFLHFDNIIQA
jgi:hypothetical protein